MGRRIREGNENRVEGSGRQPSKMKSLRKGLYPNLGLVVCQGGGTFPPDIKHQLRL